MGFRLSNVIGAPFRDFVTEQLQTRLNRSVGNSASNYNRSPEEVLYLANKTAWVSVKSSVNVEDSYVERLKYYYTETYENQQLNKDNLAKDWILQAGTSKLNVQPSTSQITGGEAVTLRSGLGLDGAYGLGGITKQGYRPMPGLDSVTIETAGRLGSLRFATINFKVWNMVQLDVIDALYFRLGYSMLVEWGHTMYFDNRSTLTQADGGVDGFFNEKVTKEEIQYETNQKVISTNGNYDAMLGVVTNFNYSYNQDGGWDCMIRLVGLGSIMDTQKINSQYDIPEGAANTYKAASQFILDFKREELLKEENRKKREALDKATKAYEDEVAGIAAGFSVRNFNQLYSAIAKKVNSTATGSFNGNDGTYVKTIIPATVIGPPPFILTPADIKREDAIINQYDKNLSYQYDNKIYPLFVTGPDGGETPYRYPLEIGTGGTDVYKLNGAALNTVIGNFTYFLPGGATAGNFTTINAFLEGILPKATSFASLYQLNSTSKTVIGQYLHSDNVFINWSNRYKTKQSTRTPWKLDFNYTIRKTDGGSGYVLINDLTNNWNTSLAQKDFSDIEWQVVEVSTTPFTLTATTDGIGDLTTSYGTIKLKASIELNNSIKVYNDSSGQSGGAESKIIYEVEMTTEILALLRELVRTSRIRRPTTQKPDANDPQYQVDPGSIQVDSEQVNKSSGLGSALEAMLTIVQYKSIQEALKKKGQTRVLKTDISDITKSLLVNLPNAPIKEVFSGNAALEKPTTSVTGRDLYLDPYSLGLKGFSSVLMGQQIDKRTTEESPEYLYNQVDTVNFKELMYSYALPDFKFNDSGVSAEASVAALVELPVYVTMGYLLYFINNTCLLYDSTKNKEKNAARPHFYIDFNPTTNFCLTTPGQLSVDPTVCLIPFEGQQADYDQIYKEMNIQNPATYIGGEYFDKQTDYVSKQLPSFRSSDSSYRAQTMNLLLNTQYLLKVLKESTDKNDHSTVYFKPFMDRILADVNKSLGDINAFRLGYIDASNTAAIFDDQFVPPSSKEASVMRIKSDDGNVIIPIFGQTSLARELRYETNISTKMSSMIAIGARGNVPGAVNNGSTQSTDASSLYWLNKGLTDRIIQQAEDIAKTKDARDQNAKQAQQSQSAEDNKKALAQKFNSHIKGTYQGTGIDKAQLQPSINYYIQSLTQTKALTGATSGTVPIPLNVEFTLDGISGINMGNVFLIPQNIVPISLRGDVVGGNQQVKWGYMVVGLTHNISNNQWTTNIKGQMIKLRDEDSYKPAQLSPGGKAPAAAPATGTGRIRSVDPRNGNLPDTELKEIPKEYTGGGKQRLAIEAADAYIRMAADAIKEGITPVITDSYRTYAVQDRIFDWEYYNQTGQRRKKGTQNTAAAYPGTSNHGLGIAIDASGAAWQKFIRNKGVNYGWSWYEGRAVSEPWHFTYDPSKQQVWPI